MANAPAVPTDLYGGPAWLLKSGDVDIPGIESAYSVVSDMDGLENFIWRYVSFRYTRLTPAGTTEDMAQWGLNLVKIQGGQLVSVWAPADYTAVDAILDPLWTTVRNQTSVSHTLVDYQYHQRSFNLDLPIGLDVPQMVEQPDGSSREVQRFAPSGPPLHVSVKNQPGQAAGAPLPYSSAMSVTFRTATRKHWGRVYLPGLHPGEVTGTYGRFSLAAQQSIADGFHDAFAALDTAGFAIVIPATQANRKYAAGLNSVTTTIVDDIPDTIRRRRSKMVLTRATGT